MIKIRRLWVRIPPKSLNEVISDRFSQLCSNDSRLLFEFSRTGFLEGDGNEGELPASCKFTFSSYNVKIHDRTKTDVDF